MTVELYLGDCLDILPTLEAGQYDAVIADLPYPKKYLPLYEHVARESARLLKSGGSLLLIVPHYAVPQVVTGVSQYLKWRWIHCMWQETGAHPRMAMGIEVMWKPIGWWVKDKWPNGRGFVRDGFENEPTNKLHYEWEQSMTWADFCLSMVPDGGDVLDPTMGVGTVGLSAVQSIPGFSFTGIEIDEERFKVAKSRIEKAQLEMVQGKFGG